MHISRRVKLTCLAIYLLSQLFFLINIQFPRTYNFDEFHYVPAAKQFLELKETKNWEHPPLGKLFMAAGIATFGDRPIGWRFMSTVFGALTLVGMYILALVIFENEPLAVWVTLLTLSNQLLYVQARIGMLDTFMFAFIVWGMAAFCATWKTKWTPKQIKQLLVFTGVMYGLGTACKWFTIIPWFATLLLVCVICVLQRWKTTFQHPDDQDWYRPQLWKALRTRDWILYLGVIPFFSYAFTFIPYLFVPNAVHSVFDFFSMQYRMWDGQLRVVTNHPYMSHWADWAILRRPIWYAFDREGSPADWVRGVILLGNPLIMWAGLIAILACFRDWVLHRKKDAFFIFYFYFVFYACWIAIPRKISFYYYYYPAGMMLSFALGYVFHHMEYGNFLKNQWARWVFLGMAFSLFIYFFPILTALKIPASEFRQWMWFSSWI